MLEFEFKFEVPIAYSRSRALFATYMHETVLPKLVIDTTELQLVKIEMYANCYLAVSDVLTTALRFEPFKVLEFGLEPASKVDSYSSYRVVQVLFAPPGSLAGLM